jgi:dolichol-phosphate mannosyltransferase
MNAGPEVSVVIPTYNERKNVASLIARLERSLVGMAAEVVFVDDSDDGTAAAISATRSSLPVHVIHREGRQRAGGLSTAVLRGVAAAHGRYVVVMDGDLQHPPETIPSLVARANASESDIVIASRNIVGGSNRGLDGPWRRFVSFFFGMVARVIFYEKLRRVKDPLSGFFLVRHAALKGITMRPIGYKISLEILIRAAGSRVEEVPYAFTEREEGESKAKLATGLTYFRHVGLLLLEVPEVGRFWKFAFVGGTGMGIFMGLLWLLAMRAGLHSGAAWALAAEAAVLSNFALNRNVTWFERRAVGGRALLSEGAKYHVASAISVAANGITVFLLTETGVGVLVAGAIAVWVGVATSFLGAERFVFTTRRALPLRRTIVPVQTPREESDEHAAVRAGRPVAPQAGRIDD